jgi:hypothetical protein
LSAKGINKFNDKNTDKIYNSILSPNQVKEILLQTQVLSLIGKDIDWYNLN